MSSIGTVAAKRGAGRAGVAFQVVATVAVAALAAVPSAGGPMLVVPLDGDGARAAGAALRAGGSLVGRGWLPGSIVIRGERGHIAAAMLREGVLVIASPTAGCSAARTAGAGRGTA